MKRVWVPLFLALFWAALVIPPAPAAGASAEAIQSFVSHVTVHPDSTMTVTETLQVRCAQQEIKRGIVREFPTTYRDRMGNTVKVGFTVQDVRRDGRTEPYHIQRVANGEKIYIGQKDVYLKPGAYTYTITYRTDHQLGYFKDYDELYWNVTGNGWTLTIERAEAVITLPPGAAVLQSAAYTGPAGAQGRDFRVRNDASGNIVFETTRALQPGEGLTIAVAWPKGVVSEPTQSEKLGFLLQHNVSLGVGVAGWLIVLTYYWVVWSRVGKDPEKGTIIPLFSPPKGLSPAAVRYIDRMGFDQKTFAAAVINLAVKGCLTIEEEKRKFTLRKGHAANGVPSNGERKVLNELFAASDAIEMKQKNHRVIRAALSGLQKTLKMEMEKIYFLTNSGYLIPGVLLSVGFIGLMTLVSLREPQVLFILFWLSIWTVGCLVLVVKVYQQWKSVLAGNRWDILGSFRALLISLFALPFLAGEALGLYMFSRFSSVTTALLLVGIMLLNVIFYQLLKAPTRLGRAVLDQIEGFKVYLSVAEKDRLDILYPPEMTPALFEKYLPYALALDVEQQWSEKFADALTQAGEGSEAYSPAWYSGNSWHTRGPSNFAESFSSSFAGAIASSSSAPGSSSGSGGGGSSGGGGGGGGGGGW